jgi:amino acid adenylation domain-containing protein
LLVQHLLEGAASSCPRRTALVAGERRVTYLDLEQEANRVAHTLSEAGVGRGDRVVILLENSVELVASIFGALKLGAVFVVLHASSKRDQLQHVLADAAPAAMVSDSRRAGAWLDVVAAAPSLRCLLWVGGEQPLLPARAPRLSLLGWQELDRRPDRPPPCPAIDLDLATLIYTSGSTGKAKGVMSTHLNMLSATTSINGYLHNTEEDVILDVLPLAFDYGLFQVFLAFQARARLVLEKGFAFPAETVSLMEKEGVTGFPGVPTVFATLLRYPALLLGRLPALRYVTNTAAALPTRHIEELQAALPGVRVFSMYGLTECKRVSFLPPEELSRRPSSVGVAIPNTEVYVAGDDGRPLPPGEVGELVIRGSHVTRGYWGAPELTAQRFRPGPLPGETVLHSGDLFKTDEEGFLYFVARKDDVIKSRGEKVSPREVEDAACQLEGVAEAAAVGVADELLGEAILLTVVPREGSDLSEHSIRAHCARTLEDFKMPRYVVLADELPRTENGKVDRLQLKADFSVRGDPLPGPPGKGQGVVSVEARA